MPKRLILFLFCLGILFFTRAAFAEVVISEIMYDVSGSDTDREWVEVYNNSSSAVDFTSWKLFEANTNHA